MTVAVARRVGWGIADQALSSLTNFGVGVLVARSVTAEDFGAFSLAFAAYLMALVVSRGLTGEPLVVRYSRVAPAEWRYAAAASTGFAVVVGIIASLLVLGIAVIVSGRVGEAFLTLSLVLPVLLVVDAWRFAFVANGRPQKAFWIDLIWIAVLVPGLLLVGGSGSTTLFLPILIWGGSALIAMLAGVAFGHTWPDLRLARTWWRTNIDLGPRFATEAVISVLAAQVTLAVLGAVSGLSAAGAFRGAQLLLGPIQVMLMGMSNVGVPEGVRILRRRGPRGLLRPATLVSIALALGTVLWGVIVSLLPAEIGVQILGDSWGPARPLVLPMAIGVAGIMAAMGAGIGIRALADARRSLRARSIHAGGELVGGVIGALTGGPLGAAIGVAMGSWAGGGAMWLAFLASVREHDRASTPSGAGEASLTTTT